MKKIKVSILALSALAGGILAASAANPVTYVAYNSWSGYTNADAKVWYVDGGPETGPGAIYPQFVYEGGMAYTDGGGKITGYGQWTIYYSTNHDTYSVINGTISGKLAGKIGSPATTTLTIKGGGFTSDSKGSAQPLKVNFSFKGQPGANLANTNDQAMVGTLTGTLTGKTPQGDKSYKIPAGRVTYIDDSSWEYAHFDLYVLQSSKGKMEIWPWDAPPTTESAIEGNGTIKNDGTYKLNGKGVGLAKGVSIALAGTVGLFTNNITVGTNTVAFPYLAPKTMDIQKNSKVQGQAIQGSASYVHAYLY